MPPPLDPELRKAILADIEAGGGTCRGIAAEHGVSRTTVSDIAKNAGLADAFGRQQTKKATEAAQVDHKAKLVVIASTSARVSQTVIDSLDTMTAQDWRKVSPYSRALIAGIMADKARELAPVDDGAEQVGSMLGKLFDQMTQRHGTG